MGLIDIYIRHSKKCYFKQDTITVTYPQSLLMQLLPDVMCKPELTKEYKYKIGFNHYRNKNRDSLLYVAHQ